MLATFDSFFAQLPNGVSIRPTTVGNWGCDIVLPKIGLKIPATLRPTSLVRLNESAVEIHADDRVIAVDINRGGSEFAAPTVPIPEHPGQTVLLAPTKMLLGDDPRGDLAGPTFDSTQFAPVCLVSHCILSSASVRSFTKIFGLGTSGTFRSSPPIFTFTAPTLEKT
jgi:hypothetical protein